MCVCVCERTGESVHQLMDSLRHTSAWIGQSMYSCTPVSVNTSIYAYLHVTIHVRASGPVHACVSGRVFLYSTAPIFPSTSAHAPLCFH